VAVLFVKFATLIVSIVSTCVVLCLRTKKTLFTPILNQDLEQRKLMVAMKFLDRKVQKSACLDDVHNSYRFKFGKISSKDQLCMKILKTG